MRQADHETVMEELQNRGFSTDWVDEYERDAVDDVEEDAKTADVLDWLEVEGQVTDGLFEDPYNGPEYDFTLFLTESNDLVGRMMYQMLSYAGLSYTYEDLVDDIEHLANTAYYDAPFDRQAALDAKPENQKLTNLEE